MSSDKIARLINEDQIQILINLNGYTKVCPKLFKLWLKFKRKSVLRSPFHNYIQGKDTLLNYSTWSASSQFVALRHLSLLSIKGRALFFERTIMPIQFLFISFFPWVVATPHQPLLQPPMPEVRWLCWRSGEVAGTPAVVGAAVGGGRQRWLNIFYFKKDQENGGRVFQVKKRECHFKMEK